MSIKSFIKSSYLSLYHTGVFNIIPDEKFICFQYRLATGKKLDLKKVSSFNEKLQWIKLYDHNPLYTMLADKYEVRKFVAERIGEEYLIPLLGIWEKPEDIDYSCLPNQFVLKCNHDSGGIAICRDKSKFDWNKEKKKLSIHLKQNHYYMSREWAYKNIKPCIIAETYMEDEKTKELRDYKFFCFNGIPRFVQVDYARFVDHKRNIYDMNWNLIDLTIKCSNDPNVKIEKPNDYEKMIEIVKKLSMGLPQVRIDLYSVNGKTYFGEMTLYHGGGYEKFAPEYYGEVFGAYIDLSLCYKN